MALGSSSSSVLHRNEENQEQDIHAPKKRRNPKIEHPDAEIIELSPTTLLAKNRFICEVCLKGFPREQNLQLHKRGHNLPWRLKQNTSGIEVKRKMYICPEPSCIHHNRSHCLGDLTGIKKHYSRKHGEKKFKCERCEKMYAVQSDLKAHTKICGNKEYQCPCGTLFVRRDSFISHRTYCEAPGDADLVGSSTTATSMGVGSSNTPQTSLTLHQYGTHAAPIHAGPSITMPKSMPLHLGHTSENNNMITPSPAFYLPSLNQENQYKYQASTSTDTGFFTNLSTSTNYNMDNFRMNYGNTSAMMPQLSATALLQKASLLGSTWSNNNSSFAASFSSSQMDFTRSGFSNINVHESNVPNYFNNGNDASMLNLNLDSTYEQPLSNMGFQESSGVAFTRDFLGVGGGIDISSDAPENSFIGRNFL